jgi:hypothetical protein
MGKILHDTNHTGQIGIGWLRWIIEGLWACGTEIISSHNDNSLDMLIFLKRRDNSAYSGPTGDIIFAQVKTGYVRKKPINGTYKINLGKKHVEEHRSRWLAFPGPVIMINVIPPRITKGNPEVYWTNLRDPTSFTASGAIVFDTQRSLDAVAGKASLFNLCWRWAELRKLPVVAAPRIVPWSKHHPAWLRSTTESFHAVCRAFYKDWMKEAVANPSKYGLVTVTNRGWRHMTRIGRSKPRMLQSLLLLPAASELLASNIAPTRLTRTELSPLSGGSIIRERYYEGVTARVTFFERHEAVVRVVLERTILRAKGSSLAAVISDKRTLFSVYEVARRRESI